MSNIDRDFLIWGMIWAVWFSVFTILALQGWTITALVVSMTSFCWLWLKFCNMMNH